MGRLLAKEHAANLVKAAERAGAKTRYKLELKPSRDHPNGLFVRKVKYTIYNQGSLIVRLAKCFSSS